MGEQDQGQPPAGVPQGVPQLTPEEIAQLREEQRQIGAANLVPAIMAFGPQGLSQQKAFEIGLAAMRQQDEISQVLQDAGPGESRDKYPYWGFIIKDPQGNGGTVHVRKDIQSCTSLSQAKQHFEVISFVTSPMARAVAFANGYRIEFFQTDKVPQGSLIVPN